MPAKTTEKGEIGEALVIPDLMRRGHDIAIPFGHNQPYDLIVIRKEDGRLYEATISQCLPYPGLGLGRKDSVGSTFEADPERSTEGNQVGRQLRQTVRRYTDQTTWLRP